MLICKSSDSLREGVMLSIARSRLAVPIHIVFLGFNSAGLMLGTIYNTKTPDLYERNLHHKFGWAMTWIVVVQLFLGLIKRSAQGLHKVHPAPLSHYEKLSHYEDEETYRYSRDSGHGTEPSSPRSSSQSTLNEEPLENDDEREVLDFETRHENEHEEGSFCAQRARIWSYLVSWITNHRALKLIEPIHAAIERTILILGFVAFTSGFVTYGGIFVST